MKKPSLKNKLTADKIEEANRLLSAQSPVSQNVAKKSVNTEGVTPVQKIETDKPTTKEKSVEKPETFQSKSKQTPQKSVIAEPQPMRLVRVTVDVPEDLHEKLKIKMILSKQTIKDYLLNFIEKDLAKTDFKFKD